MTQLCQSLAGKCVKKGDLHERHKCFVEKFILSPKNGEEINSHFTSNRDNHIYSFESIKFHTIKATFQGESKTFLRFTQRKHRPSLLFRQTVQFCGKIKELLYSTTESWQGLNNLLDNRKMAGRVRIPDLYIPRRSRYSELFSLSNRRTGTA